MPAYKRLYFYLSVNTLHALASILRVFLLYCTTCFFLFMRMKLLRY